MNEEVITKPKLVIFDLDGTLTESMQPIDREMEALLQQLLRDTRVAVISGGAFSQFEAQFLNELSTIPELFKNLYLFPTNSTVFYRYENGWQKIYEDPLTDKEKLKIKIAFEHAFREAEYKPPEYPYGSIIDDRGTQISFSALGHQAPLEVKKEWNKERDIRPRIIEAFIKYTDEFEVHSAGLTTIDITQKGINKEYGIHKIVDYLGIPKEDVLFVGDALYPSGNDEPAKRTGVECIQVSGPTETKKIIRDLLLDK